MRKCSTKVRPNPRDAPWTRNVELVDVSARFIAFEGGDGCGVGKLDENNEVGQSSKKKFMPKCKIKDIFNLFRISVEITKKLYQRQLVLG